MTAEAMQNRPGECPDLESIAAYLDGRLGERERDRVAAHIAECDDCAFIFSEAAQTRVTADITREALASRVRAWVSRPAVLWPSAAALATAAVLVAGVGLSLRWAAPPTDLQTLVTAVGTDRTVEPRLTGGFAYGRLRGPVRSGTATTNVPPDVRIAAARIEKTANDLRTPQNLAALGLAYLVSDNPADAVAALESATRDAAENAAYWSDLSAAYVERARRERHLEDLAKALNAADRATRLAPALPEAWFNRALAIEGIGGLREEAKKAWDEYLKVDSRSEWSAEARRHLAALSNQSRASWSLRKDAALRALEGDEATAVLEAAQQFPGDLREHVLTTQLPAWAKAVLEGRSDDARTLLHRARRTATGLADATSDSLLRDAIADIEAASTRPSRLNALASAYRELGEAKALFAADRLESARTLAERAADDLERLGNAMWAEALLDTAVAYYRFRRYVEAEPLIQRVMSFADAHGYAHVAARGRRLIGMIVEFRADLTAAQHHLQSSLALFERVRDTENVAFVHNLLAENYRLLGQARQSWEHHREALELLVNVDNIQVSYTVLGSAASACVNDDMGGAGLVFLDAMLENARRVGNPRWIGPVYLRRARSLAHLGALDRAMEDLGQARQSYAGLSGQSVTRANEAEALAIEGEVLREARPREAIGALTAAMGAYDATASSARFVGLYLARGRAYEQLGQYDAAEADYRDGIVAFENEHQRVRDAELRTSHYDAAWEIFARMIALQVVHRGRPEVALAFAERARARTLLETATRTSGADQSRQFSTAELQAALPVRVAVVSFIVLPDRVLSWVVTRATARFVDVALSMPRLLELVERHRADITRHADIRASLASTELYDLLVRRIASGLEPSETLMFVPDGPLHGVSFAALIDGRTARYLVEDHPVGISPSLALCLETGSPVARRGRAHDALIVGNPRTGDSASSLPELAEAEAEAKEIARLYPSTVLLTGATATRQRFLAEINRHEVLHFAGHAVQNPEFPWLSRLVMAADAPNDNPGVVFAHELVQIRFDRVRLVVLAACRTAAGPTLRGEGVLNLARPFMAAGVPAVVATLWDVDDQATRHLVVGLHQQIAMGKSPTDAVRQAQLSLLSGDDPALRLPAEWAGFVAIGAVATARN